LKNGKATGHDQILAELIKKGGKDLKNVIYELILQIWEEEIISQDWKYSISFPVHRTGD
jgi:hypothetical protein